MMWIKRALVLKTIVILIAAAMSLSTIALAQEEEMVLSAGETAQRPAVTFSHDVHMGIYDCLACHHDFQDGVNVLDEGDLEEGNPAIRCSNCHNDQSGLDLQKAFHRQCIGCHIEVRKADQVSGPEMCGACHLPER